MADDTALPICPVCGEETKRVLPFMGADMTVSVDCKCRREEREAEREKERRYQLEMKRRDMRRRCFGQSALQRCTFQQDDRKLPKISDAMSRYVDQWGKMKEENLGILLHGPVGGGKSFYAACIANALIDTGVAVKMTNFSTVVNELQESFSGRQAYLDRLAQVPLLILDDLGIERSTEYMQEHVYNIINARYLSGKPLVVTTNIPIEQITRPTDISYERIFDRVLEMCYPIKIDIPSRRREKVNAGREHKKQLLGLV